MLETRAFVNRLLSMVRSFVVASVAVASACAPGGAMVRAASAETSQTAGARTDDELESLLRADAELAAVLDEAPRRRAQVLVAIPTEDAQGRRGLRRLGLRVDAEYFYPASAVKLATAVAALEKLDEQRDARGRVLADLSTPLRVTEGEGRRAKTFETTLRDELERSLVVSDNDANNRLYALVGRNELAERMTRLGLGGTRIVHTLGDGGAGDALPPAFEWLVANGESLPISQRVDFELGAPAGGEDLLLGTAHIDESGRRVAGPMDFSAKNRMTLRDLQDLLVMTVRPDLAPGAVPRLAPPDRSALLTILGTLPSELRSARGSRRLDELHKPLHLAVVAATPDDQVRVLGKGGRAYGFAVENAYAVNERTGRCFFVTAALYANENGTLNDDRYEYATIADPFMTRLGTVLARALLSGPREKE